MPSSSCTYTSAECRQMGNFKAVRMFKRNFLASAFRFVKKFHSCAIKKVSPSLAMLAFKTNLINDGKNLIITYSHTQARKIIRIGTSEVLELKSFAIKKNLNYKQQWLKNSRSFTA